MQRLIKSHNKNKKHSGTWTLGISLSHNGSACLLHNDKLVVAIQEERLTRTKRHALTAGSYMHCVPYCLAAAGIDLAEIDIIALACLSLDGRAINNLKNNPQFATINEHVSIFQFPHHQSHAAYSVATSAVSNAAVLVVDGQGTSLQTWSKDEKKALTKGEYEIGKEYFEVASIYYFQQGQFTPLFKQAASAVHKNTHSIHGLGAMYEKASRTIFGDQQQNGKVMGLASLGSPTLPIDTFHTSSADGSLTFSCPKSVFDLEKINSSQWSGLGFKSNEAQNLAASVQAALEHGMLHYADLAKSLTNEGTLVLGGGVALNGVANERLLRELNFEQVFFPPAVEDSGNAIGAAYLAVWEKQGWRQPERQQRDSVGRCYSDEDIKQSVKLNPFVICEPILDSKIEQAVERLCNNQILGWFQEGSELGPRALGNRSILSDARPTNAKMRLNVRVKHREMYRPFAPIVLESEAENWFDLTSMQGKPVASNSPFMTRVVPINKDKLSIIPGAAHVDGTGRFQTVSEANGAIFDLLTAFYEKTGVPILINTSFNLAGEPIVESPADACFDLIATDIDALICENYLITRRQGVEHGILDYLPIFVGELVPSASLQPSESIINVINNHYVIELPIKERKLDEYYVKTQFKTGEALIQLGEVTFFLLMLINGKRSVAEIIQLANSKFPDTFAPRQWQEYIAHLVRLRLLKLYDVKTSNTLCL